APAAAAPAVRDLYRQHCQKCHSLDGTGSASRGPFPDIPDFTAASWQTRRTDAQIKASILDGKEPDLPAFSNKISEEQARGLVTHVRAFGPNKEKSGKEKQDSSDAASFDERFRKLQEEMDDLRKQFRELSRTSPGGAPSRPAESRQEKGTRPL